MVSQSWCVILNPLAGRGATLRKWPIIQSELERSGIAYQFLQTEKPGHATQLVREKINEGIRKFMAIGGDGTLQECINGFFDQDVAKSIEVVIGIFPVGTGNDWIRSQSYSKNISKIIHAMRHGKTRLTDVGKCQYQENGEDKSRYFLNVVGLAYGAFVLQYTLEHSPKILGKLVYLWYTLKCLWKYTVVPALICTESTCIEESFITMHFGIGKYAGGGMKVLPHAGKQDSYIYGMAAEQMPRIKILINMWRFYFGDITKMNQIHHFRSKEVEIKAEHYPLPVEADGELLGYTPVKISILPQAIQTLSLS